MGILGELLVKLGIRGHDDVERGLERTKNKMRETGKEAQTAGEKMKGFGSSMMSVASHAIHAASALGMVATAASGVGASAVAVQAFQDAVKFDSITRGLALYNDNAKQLEAQMLRLRELARLPGVGIEEASGGVLKLLAVGLPAMQAERAIKAVGNALASIGSGKAELEGVVEAFERIISKGEVMGHEINEIAIRVPQVRSAMKAAFGTADSEAIQRMGITATQFVQGIVTQLEKLPKATSGAKNAIENLSDAVKFALLPLGQGLVEMFSAAGPQLESLLGIVQRKMSQIGEVLAAVGRSGALGDILGKSLAPLMNLLGGDSREGVIKLVANIGSVIANLPGAVRYTGEYMNALFGALRHNVEAAFEFAERKTRSLVAGLTAVFMEFLKMGLDMVKVIAPNLFPQLSAIVQGGKNIAGVMKAFDGAFMDKVAPPQFQALPGFDFGKVNLTRDANALAGKIAPFVQPLKSVPGDVNFGHAPKDATQTALNAIQHNTFETARATKSMDDHFSLRRQAYGGGNLGALGATPAEVFGGSAPVPLGSGGFGNDLARAIERLVDERAERKVNSVISRLNGGAFRPR